MQEIGKFNLRNQGGFVTRLEFKYLDEDGNKIHKKGTGDITLGKSKIADPGDYGIPDGSVVILYAFVVWGSDNEANQSFIYKKGSNKVANYVITGTTLSNSLGYTGISVEDSKSKSSDTNSDANTSLLAFSSMSKEQIDTLKTEIENAPLMQMGAWGPISWDVDFHLDIHDLKKSYAYVKISVFGIEIIDCRIDAKNPKIDIEFNIKGVGLKAELGIDFIDRRIYIKGKLNFVFYSKDFDITLVKF